MIAIIDYGMGNLGSIHNMLNRIGAPSEITSDPRKIGLADKLILPGVGAFDRAVQSLNRLGLLPVLNERVLERKVPILGICLGMQLLSLRSEEGELPGLGWIDAETVRFAFEGENADLKIPHMGWNTIEVKRSSPILDDRHEESRFYFVHSYHVRCADEANVLATTRYGIVFHAAVIRGNIMGTQFHPEKSHKFGLKLLENFTDYAGVNTTRVIPCLLLSGLGLVKTVMFKDPKYVGDPRNAVKIFNEKEVDELVILDIKATPEETRPQFEIVREIVSEAFMPVAYGGGIRSVEDARTMLQLGVEKVVMNTAAVEDVTSGPQRGPGVRQPERGRLHGRQEEFHGSLRTVHPRRQEEHEARPRHLREADGGYGRGRDHRQLHRPGRHHGWVRPGAHPLHNVGSPHSRHRVRRGGQIG